MKPVHAQTIDSFRAGTWRVMVVTEPGTLPVLQKTAGEMQTVDVPYAAGNALLSNDRDEVICGPMSLTGITDLAERILDGVSVPPPTPGPSLPSPPRSSLFKSKFLPLRTIRRHRR